MARRRSSRTCRLVERLRDRLFFVHALGLLGKPVGHDGGLFFFDELELHLDLEAELGLQHLPEKRQVLVFEPVLGERLVVPMLTVEPSIDTGRAVLIQLSKEGLLTLFASASSARSHALWTSRKSLSSPS